MARSFNVKAPWDAEAKVWYETDIAGLVLQTKTREEFDNFIRHFAPGFLASNLNFHEPAAIRFEASLQLDLAAP